MYKIKTAFLLPLLLVAIISCGQEEKAAENQKATPNNSNFEQELITKAKNHSKSHPYGGWYCPDNFGFKPVNIQELELVPAITNRLPTQEETRNGSSLIYVDSTKFPNAYPLKMELPKLAKIYSKYKGKSEMIIVIQAIVIDNDTIVGYRFPDGGNGSAWLGQISLLSAEAVADLGSQPMVYKMAKIKANKEEIWTYFTKTDYAKELGNKFNETVFFNSLWTEDSELNLEMEKGDSKGIGWVSNHYGNIYLQIDYKIKGHDYSEKMLIGNPDDEGYSEIHFAAGPFLEDFSNEDQKWDKLIAQLERDSE